MSEVEFLLFVLELFIIRCKNKISSNDLRQLRFDIINIARRADGLEEFKHNLKLNSLFSGDCLVSKYKNKFLLYLSRFEDYVKFISHDIDKVKCYEL